MVKVNPLPDSLSTSTVSPIISQKWRVMANPKPVPPKRRVVDASAWANASNKCPIYSSVMPIPVSATAKFIHSWPSSVSRLTVKEIVPCSVNLLALLSRLNRHCLILVVSAWMDPTESGQSIFKELEFFSTQGLHRRRHVLNHRLNGERPQVDIHGACLDL